MELRNIFTFLRAAELGNFSKTAEALGYAQSTVTMQIQQLEEELGQPLFDRTNRAISLTAFGEAYLPLARRMYNTAQEMYSLNADPRELTGTLRIGIVESLFFSNFLSLISKFQERFPKVTLDFYTGSSIEIAELLQKNKLDFGCHLAHAGISTNLTEMFSRATPVVFVANKNHPLTQKGRVSLEEISKENFVLTEEIGIYHQAMLKLFHQNHLEIKANIRLKSTRGIVEVLKYSDGISFLPEYVVRQEVSQGHLGIIRTQLPCQTITVVVTTRKDKWIPPQMRGFLELLQQEKWI